MKITSLQTPETLSTIEIFGELTPQPTITIQPVHQRDRQSAVREATRHSLLPYPDKEGYQVYEEFDQWKFMELLTLHSVTELHDFEDHNGTPVQAEADGILTLLRTLPAEFALWLYKHILRISDLNDLASEDARKNFLNGRKRIASAMAKK